MEEHRGGGIFHPPHSQQGVDAEPPPSSLKVLLSLLSLLLPRLLLLGTPAVRGSFAFTEEKEEEEEEEEEVEEEEVEDEDETGSGDKATSSPCDGGWLVEASWEEGDPGDRGPKGE